MVDFLDKPSRVAGKKGDNSADIDAMIMDAKGVTVIAPIAEQRQLLESCKRVTGNDAEAKRLFRHTWGYEFGTLIE